MARVAVPLDVNPFYARSFSLHARHAWGCIPDPLSLSKLRVDASSVN